MQLLKSAIVFGLACGEMPLAGEGEKTGFSARLAEYAPHWQKVVISRSASGADRAFFR